LKIALTNQNGILKEIESKLNLGNACCHTVHNILTSHVLVMSSPPALVVYETIILSVLYMGAGLGSLTLREEYRLVVLRGVFGLKRVGLTESRNRIMRSFII
jgi:hypothetical protein